MSSNRKQLGVMGGRGHLFPQKYSNPPPRPRMMSGLPSSLLTKNKVKEKVLVMEGNTFPFNGSTAHYLSQPQQQQKPRVGGGVTDGEQAEQRTEPARSGPAGRRQEKGTPERLVGSVH